jgi:hypothetical protein
MHVARAGRLAVLGVVLLGGCTAKSPGAKLLCRPPECAADTQLQLTAEVDPPAPLPAQEFAALTIDAHASSFHLTLDPPVTFSGKVSVAGLAGKPLTGNVVATRQSRILGRPDVYYEATIDPLTGEYSLVVAHNLPGETYKLRVTAASDIVPPQQFSAVALNDEQRDLELDDPATLPQLTGTVSTALQTGVAGLQVQATDPTSGALLSTTATSDAQGHFALKLAKTLPSLVRVVATPTSALGAADLPTLFVDVDTSSLGPTSTLTTTIALPPLPTAVRYNYNVVGQSASGAQVPVVGAACTFFADVSDPKSPSGTKAYYAASATTDATGLASVDLIPLADVNRSYQLMVAPDPTSHFASTSATVNVAPQGGWGQMIVLQRRAVITGRVLDPTGQPLANVLVVPTTGTLGGAVAPAPPNSAATQPRLGSIATGTDGRFALPVDASGTSYDVQLIAPPEKPLPRVWLSTQVTSDVDLGDIHVPRGVVVQGVVRDSSGKALQGAGVRLYTIPPADAACGGNGNQTCLEPARLRAEGATLQDGTVSLILPSAPAN